MTATRHRALTTARFAVALATTACVAALLIWARDGSPKGRAQIDIIRRDRLAVLAVDNGRTRVLFTSSLIDRTGTGYQELGPLLVFAHDEVQPGSGFKMHAHENVDVLTIVLQGSLDQEDSAGHRAHVEAGEAALMSAGSGVKHAEFGNPAGLTCSLTIWFRPRTMNKAPSHATGKPVEKDGWQLIAAEQDAPLIIEQDARVRMKRLDARQGLRLVAQRNRLIYMAPVKGELRAGRERLSVPDRIILRAGVIDIASDVGATIVVVDVPTTDR
jgi:redox-sensitive bicupin YhaK (pirin superfamily)